MSDIDPARAEYLRKKYVDPAPSLGQAVITAEAEQLTRAVLDTHAACEAYNAEKMLDWLTLDLPPQLRDRIDQYRARLRDAQSRESRGGGKYVHYYDDRNSHDEANGWPAFSPDKPHLHNVPFGHILSERAHTVHVLRGGTEPLFGQREDISRYEKPSETDYNRMTRARELDDPDALADFGHSYDFATFFSTADRRQIVRFCDLHLPDGCKNGLGGSATRMAAIPMGRDIYMINLCKDCIAVLYRTFAAAHPKWKKKPPAIPGPWNQTARPSR
jgi:hypothetical protein